MKPQLPPHLARSLVIALLLLATSFTFLLFLPFVTLPNLYDTLLHIRISGGLNWRSVWSPTADFGFYRPFTFVPFILVRQLWGDYPALVLNSLNLLNHTLNTFLLGWLVARLFSPTKVWVAVATALLFGTFPFAYQAVAIYGHNVHPAIGTLLLCAMHTTLSADNQPQQRRWLYLTFVFFLLGLLHHESAVIMGAWSGLLIAFRHPLRRDAMGSRYRLPLLLLFSSVIYVALYQFLPISRGPQATAEGLGFDLKLLYLGQTLSYPAVRWLNILPLPAHWLILLGCALTLIAIIGRWRDVGGGMLLGLGWWLTASLLIAIPLPTGYLLNGPRLLYVGGIGLALLWALILNGSRSRPILFTLTLLLLLATLVRNAQFIGRRENNYRELTRPLHALQGHTAKHDLILINLPQWLAPVRNEFPLGSEFVQQLGDYLFIEEWIDHNLGKGRTSYGVKVDDLLKPTQYGYGIHAQHRWSDVQWADRPIDLFAVQFDPDAPQTTTHYFGRASQQRQETLLPSATNAVAEPPTQIGPYQLWSAEGYWCDGTVTVSTVWQKREVVPPTTSSFVQLLDGEGKVIAQLDRPILGVRPDLLAAPDSWYLSDQRELSVATIPTQLLIGIYDYATGQRYEVKNSAENALVLPITYCR